MYKLLRSGIRLFTRSAYVCHIGDKTYKIYNPIGANHRSAELSGNKSALNNNFWRKHVIQVEPNLLCFTMTRGQPISLIRREAANLFMNLKLEQANEYPKQAVSKGINFDRIAALKHRNLKLLLIEKAKEKLNSMHLPITSSHGDLHINNMIYHDSEIKLIDWSMFNNQGSFVTDFIHYHNYYDKVKLKSSWSKSILKEQDYLNLLANSFNTTPLLLKLAYSITRIDGEVSQARSINSFPTEQIDKYNVVLTHLLDEF